MRFEELNWKHVEDYLQKDDRIMLVLGACEQHGYLSLLTDVKIPLAMADAAAQSSGVLIAPALPFGVSPYFDAYPGTISLRLQTFLQVVDDIVRNLYRSGFRKILVLNGHGGNQPARTLLSEIVNECPGLVCVWYSWWTSRGVARLAESHKLIPAHASWMEAFSFTQVAELPEGEKEEAAEAFIMEAGKIREQLGDGVFGGTYKEAPEIMQQLFDLCLGDILYELEELKNFSA
jgi:creatinine amidohydrolase